MKLGQNVCLDKISDEFQNWSCLVKNKVTRSNLTKPRVCSRGHIFNLIIMKLGQNFCLDEISGECENRSCLVKNCVTRSNPMKTLCTL